MVEDIEFGAIACVGLEGRKKWERIYKHCRTIQRDKRPAL